MASLRTIFNFLLLAVIVITGCLQWIYYNKIRLENDQLSIKEARLSLFLASTASSSSVRVATNENVHLVFSSGCSSNQEWQSQALIWSILYLARQKGKITRIISGCTTEQRERVQRHKLHPRVKYHITPTFADAESFHFFNKPLGLDHWLKEANPPVTEEVIVILDPDMIMFTPVFQPSRIRRYNDSSLLCSSSCRNRHLKTPKEKARFASYVSRITDKLRKGTPVAQTYGLRSTWLSLFNLSAICGENSACKSIDPVEVRHKYSVGPPYILHLDDLKRLVPLWKNFMQPVYNATQGKDVLADMYAYALAAIHLELPHLALDHFMVSKVDTFGEAWPWVKKLLNNTKPSGPSCDNPLLLSRYPQRFLPVLFHYAQRYEALHTNSSLWLMQKTAVPRNLLTCEVPLLLQPPENFIIEQSTERNQSHAWSICATIKYINDGVAWWKRHNCNSSINLKRKIRLSNSLLHCKEGTRYKSCWSHAYIVNQILEN